MTNLKNIFRCLFLAQCHLEFEPSSFCFSELQGFASLNGWNVIIHWMRSLKWYSSLYLKNPINCDFLSFLFFFSSSSKTICAFPFMAKTFFFIEFQICLELTKHNIWISIQEGRLIWKLFNAPGPQWDQIEEQFLWAECKWIRNMWIKFLSNLKGNLNIKEKCFANGFMASDKVRHLKKRVSDDYWIQNMPSFFFLSQKKTFWSLHKREKNYGWEVTFATTLYFCYFILI